MAGLLDIVYIGGSFLASWLLLRRTQRRVGKKSNEHKKVFVLAVGLKFRSVEEQEAFLAVWRPLAEYVRAEEPETLSFELCIADTDPTKVLVYERYTTKEAFMDVHRTSRAFLTYKAAQQALPFAASIEISGQSYYETNIGFM